MADVVIFQNGIERRERTSPSGPSPCPICRADIESSHPTTNRRVKRLLFLRTRDRIGDPRFRVRFRPRRVPISFSLSPPPPRRCLNSTWKTSAREQASSHDVHRCLAVDLHNSRSSRKGGTPPLPPRVHIREPCVYEFYTFFFFKPESSRSSPQSPSIAR